MRVINHRNGAVLATSAAKANTGATRRTGLLRHDSLPAGEGLWIVPCEGVHTVGMRFAIDVVFLNKQKKVLKIRPDMGKWRFSLCLRARSVLELPAGTVAATGTAVGDVLEFES